VPHSARQACENLENIPNPNPGLIFDRFVQFQKDGKGEILLEATTKFSALERVIKVNKKLENLTAFWLGLQARWQQQTTGASRFSASIAWRFVTGLGQKGPLEIGFTFHRLYGIPIIPGSGLKGLAASYAELAEGKKLNDPDYVLVFGDQDHTGQTIFFDAIPLEPPALEIDIMNVHYPRYYENPKENPPAAWEKPNPIFFLTVGKHSAFQFAIGSRGPNAADRQNAQRLAKDWLQNALEQMGAGSKTSAGYGAFSIDNPADGEPSGSKM
jgi:CRISPR-associated protein Cmr6